MPEFAGLKIAGDRQAANRYGLQAVRIAETDRMLMAEAGVVGSGGNSGFQALNLALQFGASRVILVGFDLSLAGGLHWHGRHAARLNNPTAVNLARWAERLDRQAAAIAELGVEVLNASPTSALTAFAKVPLKDALSC